MSQAVQEEKTDKGGFVFSAEEQLKYMGLLQSHRVETLLSIHLFRIRGILEEGDVVLNVCYEALLKPEVFQLQVLVLMED